METIEYGGLKEEVEKQLVCNHPQSQWLGPCIDEISRYYKCNQCRVLIRDIEPEQLKEKRREIYLRGFNNRWENAGT